MGSCLACSTIASFALRSEALSAVTTFSSEVTQDNLKDQRMHVIGQLSGAQLQAFLRSATTCLATTHDYTYNLVRASRTRAIPADISDFYQKCIEVEFPDLDAARFIASTRMMDHYSLEMPREFFLGSLLTHKLTFRD